MAIPEMNILTAPLHWLLPFLQENLGIRWGSMRIIYPVECQS